MLIPDLFAFWTDEQHEIDFVISENQWLEVKLGQASPHEFSFLSMMPRKIQTNVICTNRIHTQTVKSIKVRDFMRGEV